MADAIKVAIIGSGPSGYYAAEALCKADQPVEIDILDRLPTPYGLIRGGVAPDHQSIKAVSKRFEKTSLNDDVRFVGHIEVGKDICLEHLQTMFDAVIIATGAPLDRKLNIKGEDKKGVIGSASFVGWYNSHPDFADLDPEVDVKSVVVIGNGNVAIDVARVLAKTESEMATSDLAQHAATKIHRSNLEEIWLVGRRGPMEGKFTQKELGEMGNLEKCTTLAKIDQIPTDIDDDVEPVKKKNLSHLQSFAQNKKTDKQTTVNLEFFAKPVEILGEDHVEAMRFERTKVEDGKCIGTGEMFDIPCQLVVPCIGYLSEPIEGAEFNENWGLFANDDGVMGDNLYVVGWAKRGPSGTIGTNRIDAFEVVDKLLENTNPSAKEGRSALNKHIAEHKIKTVSFEQWKLIEAMEESLATDPSPRKKIAHIDKMLEIIKY